jgi:eukaryotic-like serine/threonine-protein kinase
LDPTRRNQISELYHAALTRAPDERRAFLTEACGDDEALRAEVESLLRYDAESFLETPAAQVAVAEVAAAGSASMVHRQLGPYRILAPLGVGGMGEVYRAHDSKLGREVAIKILPPHFTSDPERRARFAREARMLASLNHPHIGAIYGLEDSDGVTALVLELVEGPTLADRLARGPLPVTKALAIARQVAEALDAAHERGIVHRDLKPSNIVLQGDTAVTSGPFARRCSNFGLAKPIAEAVESAPTVSVDDTADGRILGTPAYMSPEQARGLPVDRRTDIWAFGCLLYELLTGARAFRGHTTSELIVAILTLEPDLSRLPGTVPPRVVDLLQRCLMKDPRERLRDIGDARNDLREVSVQAPGASSSLPKSRSAWQRAATAAIGVAAFGLAAWGVVAAGLWPRSNTMTEWVSPLVDANYTQLTNNPGTEKQAAISPDGKFVAFLSDRDGQMNLMLMQVGTGRVTNLSPNSPPIGFGAGVASVGFSWDGSEVWTTAGSGDSRSCRSSVGGGGYSSVILPAVRPGRRMVRLSSTSTPSMGIRCSSPIARGPRMRAKSSATRRGSTTIVRSGRPTVNGFTSSMAGPIPATRRCTGSAPPADPRSNSSTVSHP